MTSVPPDFHTVRLGDVARIGTGSKNNQDKDPRGRYPFFVRSATVERIGSYTYNGEAILVPGEGRIGSIFHYVNGKFDTHQRVYRISEFDGVVGRYVYYYMRQFFGDHAMRHSVKATVDSLRLPTFKKFEMVLPQSLAEQKRIAAALSDVDDLIECLADLISKKSMVKSAAAQRALSGESPLTRPRSEWDEYRLGDLGQWMKGRGIRKSDVTASGVPCVRYGELYTRYQNYAHALATHVPHEVAATALPIRHGDLLFTASGETSEEIGTCMAYIGDEFAVAGGDLIGLRLSDDEHNPVYLSHVLNSPAMLTEKARLGQGNAVVHINARSLGGLDMRLPSRDEQDRVVEVLQDMDAEIRLLRERLQKTRALKQGMMQELLTGRTRLPQEAAA